MPAPNSPLLEDRPLDRSAGDLLGFDAIAAGLAAQLQATTSGGLLAAVAARRAGCGRSSFLNLLHARLLERGVGVLRVAGSDSLPDLLRRARAPAGAPPPVALVDDAEPERLASLDAPPGAPAIVAAWMPGKEAAGHGPCPLLVRLPGWNEQAAASWLSGLFGELDADEAQAWRGLLLETGSPREALLRTNAATAACAGSPHPRRLVVAAVATALGLPSPLPLPSDLADELVSAAARYCGALQPAASPPAPHRAAAEEIFGEEPEHGLDTAPEEPAAAGQGRPEIEGRRRRCVELAGRGGPQSTEELLRLLADEHPSVRLSASHALAALADPAAAPELRRLLASGDASLRRTAAFVLGKLGDEGSRDELVRLLVDVNAGVRRAAAAALGRLGGEAVARPLLLALDDQHAGVRMAAETALSRILSSLPESFVDGLARACDERVRRAAVRAAGRLGFGSRQVLESLLLEPGRSAVDAAEALGRRRESGSLPALARAVAGDRGDLRTAALEAVGRICDGSAASGLAGLLSHGDPLAREAAKRALARCPGAYEAVLPFLGESDESLRSSAADALGRCGDQRAIGPLLEAHDQGDAELRRAAAASLVRLGFEP